MTDDELHAWIIGLIERNMCEQNRKQALEWLEIRVARFDAMKHSGLSRRRLGRNGLQTKK